MCVCVCVLSHVQLFTTPWTVACQIPLFMGFSWQEYWSGLPFPSPGDLPKPGIQPASFASPALADRFFTTEPPENKTLKDYIIFNLLFILNISNIQTITSIATV